MRKFNEQGRAARGESSPGATTSIAYGVFVLCKRQRDIQSSLEIMGVSFERACWRFHFQIDAGGPEAPLCERTA